MKSKPEDHYRCEYQYVYCDDILGVETNIKNFKWVYGSHSEISERDAYEKCAVKFRVVLTKETDLGEADSCDGVFQSYSWNKKANTLFYRRRIFGNLLIGYNITLNDTCATVFVGKNYFKLIRGRIMNLHGIYYLLSDLANILLLKKGYLTLYASAVHFEKQNRGVVCFAPPNTGKTLTSTKLCEMQGNKLLGEDIVLTDSERMFACPYTQSYRKKPSRFDSAGSFGRKRKENENCCKSGLLTDLVVLSLGRQRFSNDKENLLRKIRILNGYLFQYYSSPIVKVISYFNSNYEEEWNDKANQIIDKAAARSDCLQIQTESPHDFCRLIQKMISNENEVD